MCGRYTQGVHFGDIASRFHAELWDRVDEQDVARYNVSPSQSVLIVVGDDAGRRLIHAAWGLRPAWVSADSGIAPINARSETAASLPMFRAALRKSRCLIPADGFYEWRKVPGQKRKQPFYFRLRGGGLFAFAGLWQPPNENSGGVPTCTILTTAPNEMVKQVHNRMPVILEPAFEELWLDRSVTDAAQVTPLLRAYPAEQMEAYRVREQVSSPSNDGPGLIEPDPAK
jgi:putative SOS response-associated peptidase YedK